MPGKFKMDPRTGTLLMKPTTTGKKPLGEEKTVLCTCIFFITKINCKLSKKNLSKFEYFRDFKLLFTFLPGFDSFLNYVLQNFTYIPIYAITTISY